MSSAREDPLIARRLNASLDGHTLAEKYHVSAGNAKYLKDLRCLCLEKLEDEVFELNFSLIREKYEAPK